MQALRLLLRSALLLVLLLSISGLLQFAAAAQPKLPPGVYIFYSPECPICAEYFRTIERLHAKYSKFAEFYLVVSDKASASKLKREFKTSCRIIEDMSGSLQKELNATVMPQVFLLNQERVIYSGRIDDRYQSIGNRRTVIRSFDLENALAALAKGEKTQLKSTTAVGCFLERPE